MADAAWFAKIRKERAAQEKSDGPGDLIEGTRVIVMSDDGKDLDDELAKVMMSSLMRRGSVTPLGFVANLAPALQRARLAKGTLNELGFDNVPVAVGSEMMKDGGIKSGKAYEFDVPYMADTEMLEQCTSVDMCSQALEICPDGSVVIVLLSGLTDAWALLEAQPDLFKLKVARVVAMAGIEVDGEEVKKDANGFMVPDQSQNNTFDWESSTKLFEDLQRRGIPTTVVSRWAAYAAKLPLSIYDRMAKTCHPVGVRLHRAQRHSLEHLWKRCCLPDKHEDREGLPGRCDKNWFCNVFLSGAGKDRSGSDSIWDLSTTFQAYDPVALLAGITSLRERFFKPITVTIKSETGPVDHEIIGLTETLHGIRDGSALANFISTALLTGLTGTAAETVFQDVMVMSDDGKDLDDELAKVLMKSLTQRDLTKCHGYIANLAPADMRARLAKGTLDALGLAGEVGVGSAMTDKCKTTEYEFDVPYLADGSDHADG